MKDRKRDLIALGAETLAETLLKLAERSEEAARAVECLTAAPEEHVLRIKKELARLDWSDYEDSPRDSWSYVEELEQLLRDLENHVTDPFEGLDLVATFYETDRKTLGYCDAPDDYVIELFRLEAQAVFEDYATRCPDKEKVAELILRLCRVDRYGVRDALIDFAEDWLPESMIDTMIAKLQKWADGEKDEHQKYHLLTLVQSLALQIDDLQLYERTRLASFGYTDGKAKAAACIDIARVYLVKGDVRTAAAWLRKIPEGETSMVGELERLWIEVSRKLGDETKLAEVLYRKFQSHRTLEALQELLDVVGQGEREKLVTNEVALILENPHFWCSDVAFLRSTGQVDALEFYTIDRAKELEHANYEYLLSLAEFLEREERLLASTVIYRGLLTSILRCGRTKSYSYGVGYLKKLDELSVSITDWKHIRHHTGFVDELFRDHGRKRTFWSKYDTKRLPLHLK
ncbi:hypothetical protein SCOR_31625 [Sulfidibacter corallicola]|uniref:Uncharacterized protein n=1 Tax=Sulfidibacter corallicola TaxID=2818388 RepID=A0A8A4TLZ4_SULCO|nr:DUF6880 family protein [Sulfidibacter corallicola]QTD49901.1 hypothetical protein J3U87_30330 [Sulfidibacter corallicola]